jgi:hypothetical protein
MIPIGRASMTLGGWSMAGAGAAHWVRGMLVAMAMLAGCGPEVGPPIEGLVVAVTSVAAVH